jgi:uncharacterized protein YegL
MAHIYRVGAAVTLLLFIACGSPGPDSLETSQCLKLSLPGDGLRTELPAKVSLFFRVDTCEGEPVSNLSAQDFEIREDGSLVSRYESQQAIGAKTEKFRLYSLLALDMSGSIVRANAVGSLQKAAQQYVDSVVTAQAAGGEIQLGIYAFDGRATPVPIVEFTSDPTRLKGGIACIAQDACARPECAEYAARRACGKDLTADESTNLNGAVLSGLDRLDGAVKADTVVAQKESALVVFTDGTDQAGYVPQAEVNRRVQESKAHVFAVGLGGEAAPDVLRQLGKDGYEQAANVEGLSRAFELIAQRVRSLASRFYLLEYCSPKRSGVHQLEVVASLPLPGGKRVRGNWAGNFDASGFSGGCVIQ